MSLCNCDKLAAIQTLAANTTYIVSLMLADKKKDVYKATYKPLVFTENQNAGVIEIYDLQVCILLSNPVSGMNQIEIDFLGLNISFDQMMSINITRYCYIFSEQTRYLVQQYTEMGGITGTIQIGSTSIPNAKI